MSKTYRPYSPHQSFLLPPSPHDWLPEGHLAYFILDLVAELDLSPILSHYERELRGFPPHHPQMMLALLLYAYASGVPSSRRIERKTYEDVAFRVIAGGTHPDHTRISEFRRIHLKAIEGLFVQVLQLCSKAGLVKLGHVAIGGTKVKANASKHKAMSYERMQKQEEELEKKVAELKDKAKRLLDIAETTDAEEDARLGPGVRGDELPKELRRSQDRLERTRAAKAALEAEAKANHERKKAAPTAEKSTGDDDDEPGPQVSPLPSHKVPANADGNPTPKAQRNFTDPDSRIQKAGTNYVQGYNCQAAVDAKSQVIVAQAATNQPPDVQHLAPMLDRVIANCGKAPKILSADAGYFSEENVRAVEGRGVDPYIATGRLKHGEKPPVVRGRKPAHMTTKQRMARKLATKSGANVYKQRKAIVEPVFGYIKEARGLRSFLLRSLAKVQGEWSLICTTHNLLKLFAAAAR